MTAKVHYYTVTDLGHFVTYRIVIPKSYSSLFDLLCRNGSAGILTPQQFGNTESLEDHSQIDPKGERAWHEPIVSTENTAPERPFEFSLRCRFRSGLRPISSKE